VAHIVAAALRATCRQLNITLSGRDRTAALSARPAASRARSAGRYRLNAVTAMLVSAPLRS